MPSTFTTPTRAAADRLELIMRELDGATRIIASLPRAETVRVRIAVAVDHLGNWQAVGYPALLNGDAFRGIVYFLEPGEARYFIEAELALPGSTMAADKVERAPDLRPTPEEVLATFDRLTAVSP